MPSTHLPTWLPPEASRLRKAERPDDFIAALWTESGELRDGLMLRAFILSPEVSSLSTGLQLLLSKRLTMLLVLPGVRLKRSMLRPRCDSSDILEVDPTGTTVMRRRARGGGGGMSLQSASLTTASTSSLLFRAKFEAGDCDRLHAPTLPPPTPIPLPPPPPTPPPPSRG